MICGAVHVHLGTVVRSKFAGVRSWVTESDHQVLNRPLGRRQSAVLGRSHRFGGPGLYWSGARDVRTSVCEGRMVQLVDRFYLAWSSLSSENCCQRFSVASVTQAPWVDSTFKPLNSAWGIYGLQLWLPGRPYVETLIGSQAEFEITN